MYIRRNTAVKYCFALVLGAAFYAEVIVYHKQALHWQELKCLPGDASCTKILFIADPQIQGDQAVAPPLSYLFNWDSDRYLGMTFTRVVRFFQPDILVYLGDLMDEGSIATPQEFQNYVKRLSNIFDNVPYPVHQVWIPGDNDIGGENEPIRWDKVKLFEQAFEQPPVVAVKNVTFYKINAITHSFPKLGDNVTDASFKIGVSHYPVVIRRMFNTQLRQWIRPDIYFCAHKHESKYTVQVSQSDTRDYNFYGKDVLDIGFGEGTDMYEIYVPTCSYRMGTNKIGYGAAVLDSNNTRLRYTVFWSPERFPYLFVYSVLLVLLLLYAAVSLVRVCYNMNLNPFTYLRLQSLKVNYKKAPYVDETMRV